MFQAEQGVGSGTWLCSFFQQERFGFGNKGTRKMPHARNTMDTFIPTANDLATAALMAIGGLIALVLAFALGVGIWRLFERIPWLQERERMQVEAWAIQQKVRGLEADLARLGKSTQVELDSKQVEVNSAKALERLAQAGLEEARQSGEQLQAKALEMVRQAAQGQAATAAEAKRLQAEVLAAKTASALQEQKMQELGQSHGSLRARYDEVLADVRKLRDCQHLETSTVYTRETDPATGQRPYRNRGSLCNRCGFVLTATPTGLPVVSEPGLPNAA